MDNILNNLGIDYLLVNATNEFLVEYSSLSENARYTLTGFSGSTGDALLTQDKIYLFVDGRYHTQADIEAKDGVTVVKLKIGQKQDDEIRKLIDRNKILGIVSKKVSQARLETFSGYKIKLLDIDPINNFSESHSNNYEKGLEPAVYEPEEAHFITNLEEVSYLMGLRDFSKDCSSKIWAKLFVKGKERKLFTSTIEYENYLKNIDFPLVVDKSTVSAYDYSIIKNPVHKPSEIKKLKSLKSEVELAAYKQAFECTDKTMMAIREYIEKNENLSEYDISMKLKELFVKYGAKGLSFNSIVAINQNSALAHYAKNAKDIILCDGSLVLIDCGAYYQSGLATDITRVFVKGTPTSIQKEVYTMVLKAFLNAFNYESDKIVGKNIDTLAHEILDNAVSGFKFNHGLGHGIGINVHEVPPNLSQNEIANTQIMDNMTFTIEPGLYNPEFFGVRLENSCYMKNGKIHSFVKMGYEGKLINYKMMTTQEKKWLEEFEIL